VYLSTTFFIRFIVLNYFHSRRFFTFFIPGVNVFYTYEWQCNFGICIAEFMLRPM